MTVPPINIPFVSNLFNKSKNYTGNNIPAPPNDSQDAATLAYNQPSLTVGYSLNQMGKSQYGPFGSYLMQNLGPNMNTLFDIMTPTGSGNTNKDRENFYRNYTSGIFDANSPLHLNYGDVGNLLKDSLSGASNTVFSQQLMQSDPSTQASAISDFIKAVGTTTMGATTVNLIQGQLSNIYQGYYNGISSGTVDPNSTNFVQYLVSKGADFLDQYFGGGFDTLKGIANLTPPDSSSSGPPVKTSNTGSY